MCHQLQLKKNSNFPLIKSFVLLNMQVLITAWILLLITVEMFEFLRGEGDTRLKGENFLFSNSSDVRKLKSKNLLQQYYTTVYKCMKSYLTGTSQNNQLKS